MNTQDAIDIVDNTANLCRDIGAKGRSEELKEVAKFIEHIQYDAKVKQEHHDKVLKNFQAYREEQEKKIASLELEIQARYEEDAGAGL